MKKKPPQAHPPHHPSPKSGGSSKQEAAAAAGPNVWLWSALVAVFAVLLVYGSVLSAPFVFDDLNAPFLAPDAAAMPLKAWVGITRPLTMVSYWLNFQMGGTSPTGYHVTNVLLHLGAACFLALVVRKLVGAGRTGELVGAFCGLLFLIHPLETEAVSYVSSRSEVLAVCLLWAALARFLYRKTEEASWVDGAMVFALFGLAVLSKEYSVVFPALLLLADLYFGGGAAGVRRNWRVYVPMVVGGLAGAGLVAKVLLESTTAGFGLKGNSAADYFLTQCRVIWIYVFKFVFPVGQTVDYDLGKSNMALSLAGLVALAAVTGAAVVYRKRFPLVSYGWLIFLILLAPTSSFLPIADVIAERRAYLPSLGLLLIAAEFLRRIDWTGAKWAALAAVLVAYGVLGASRNEVWASDEALWRDAVAKSPEKSRPHFQLARIFYEAGQFGAASAEYEKVASTGGADHTLYLNWGLALDEWGKPEAALEKLNQAAALQPSAHVYSQIARVYGRQGKNEPALAALEKAEKADPNFEMTYVYRANIYMSEGDALRAVEQYNRALAINPRNLPAQEGLRLAQNRR